MEFMQGFVSWLANKPTPDEICRALITDYLIRYGACCARLGRLNKDDSYHYLGQYGFDTNETGKLVPGQIWRTNKDIEVNQIAAGHQPGPWTSTNKQVLIELRAKGSTYGWMNILFSAEKDAQQKKEIVKELNIYALAISLYLSLTRTACVADRLRERIVTEVLRRLFEQQSGLRHLHRRIRILARTRTFEHIAARDLLAAKIARLARDAAELVEPVVIRFEFIIGHAPILDRHVRGYGARAVAVDDVAAAHVVAWQIAPVQPAPVVRRAADATCRQERAHPAHRQREVGGAVPERDGFQGRVLHQLLAIGVFQLVADAGHCEELAGRHVLAALKADHCEPRLGQLARHDRAGPAHADHDRVDFLQPCRHVRPLKRNRRWTAVRPSSACCDTRRSALHRRPASPDNRPCASLPCCDFRHRSGRRRNPPS